MEATKKILEEEIKDRYFFDNLRIIFFSSLFYFKKIFLNIWTYFAIIFIPIILDLALLCNIYPTFILFDTVYYLQIIMITFLFYGLIFFNIRRSHLYYLFEQKVYNHKFIIYLPIFINLLIITFITFIFSMFIFYIIRSFDFVVVDSLKITRLGEMFEFRTFDQFRWGLFIYCTLIVFLITFALAFFIQTISNDVKRFFIIAFFIIIMTLFFSGSYQIQPGFNEFDPYASNVTDYYSYDSETRILTITPYFDRNQHPEYCLFYDFTFSDILSIMNPYYWISQWGQFDIFMNTYKISIIDPNPIFSSINIDPNDPSTWVLYSYKMFSFKSLLWSCYIIIPYFIIISYLLFGGLLSKFIEFNR